jgi:hypothetical protein
MNETIEVNTALLRIWLSDCPVRRDARKNLCKMADISKQLLVKMLSGKAPRIPEIRYRISKVTGIKERDLFPSFVPLDDS